VPGTLVLRCPRANAPRHTDPRIPLVYGGFLFPRPYTQSIRIPAVHAAYSSNSAQPIRLGTPTDANAA
jgi:hypothetical protein